MAFRAYSCNLQPSLGTGVSFVTEIVCLARLGLTKYGVRITVGAYNIHPNLSYILLHQTENNMH